MADFGPLKADETTRLEAALERIARSGHAPRRIEALGPTAELAARLDALIIELRAILRKDWQE